MARLTERQRQFCNEYLIDLNATQAAIRAGYSKNTARNIGQENLTKLNIQAEIKRAMVQRTERTNITADRVLNELAKIGFSDINNFVTFGNTEEVISQDEQGNKTIRVFAGVCIKPDSQIDGSVLSEVKMTSAGISVKLHDKLKALEMIGKHLGLFVEKHEIAGKDGGPVLFRFVDPKENRK